MAEEDDRWALNHLKDCDERESSFGVGTFRWKGPDGLVHRVLWSRRAGGWAAMCDFKLQVPREVLNDEHGKAKAVDPGAVTCILCLGNGA